MKSLEPFLALLAAIPNPRRAEGKLYRLPHVLLFSIFAIVSGANSYLGIQTYFKAHLRALNKAFKIKWKRAPAHTAIRYILQGLDPAEVEKAFREHSANLNFGPDAAKACDPQRLAVDIEADEGHRRPAGPLAAPHEAVALRDAARG